MQADFQALFHALTSAWNLGYWKVEVNLDSEVVVKLLSVEEVQDRRLVNLIVHCGGILNQPWQVTLSHCYKEAKRVANKLANLAVEASLDCHLLRTPPGGILNLVRWDRSQGSRTWLLVMVVSERICFYGSCRLKLCFDLPLS
ncbi:uncharacterized protein LOC131172890 [Hevea brasiliensis]|uniref:uncharacterized protein LOC131172890 n=1 Tax=Hevea brasiliensis TaxID=3981 RepID=UPI0025F36456|nr:uncharacterized protein LOC131172890 [Hevea brasiliensis]